MVWAVSFFLGMKFAILIPLAIITQDGAVALKSLLMPLF